MPKLRVESFSRFQCASPTSMMRKLDDEGHILLACEGLFALDMVLKSISASRSTHQPVIFGASSFMYCFRNSESCFMFIYSGIDDCD